MTGPAVTVAAPSARLDHLTVTVATSAQRGSPQVRVLDEVSLDLFPGEVTVLVGESGCGKSMVAAALCGLLPPGAVATGGVSVDGATVGDQDSAWGRLRGHVVGLVPQSPSTSFTPVRTLGSQLGEVVSVLGGPRSPSELCDLVGLSRAALACYPHELSGGMAQRAAIAAAVAGEPRVLLADEPTSALDPELAHRIWELLADSARAGAAVLAITHDLASLRRAGIDTRIAVMRGGRLLDLPPGADPLRAPAGPDRSEPIHPATGTAHLDDAAYLHALFGEDGI
ncbi:ATP-binding cassette domain-containing protein [Gordonia iterans]|uniref:ATP-binding cassette domain-containing protein n=1 Tax=Gordonia iterans TaxID=1004901 RepID=UPI001F23059E|nr:ATP-binding cassette domain-containing protein [Gordonia iterans]